MSLQFYDTYRRKKRVFESLIPGEVRMYTCGPTVYAEAHIGNFRTYIFEDLLRRTLKFSGYKVKQVMNLTDVDDKTIQASNQKGIKLEELTAPVIEKFFGHLKTLGIERAEIYPTATTHVAEMIEMVQTLIDKGHAYIQDGSVYFSIDTFPQYGNLSGMKLEKLQRGVRIDADEYEKENFRDFALWKAWTEADGDVYWDSPFGRGRPGWHIECSAMSKKYLGEEFDIHTGGVDNIFPHHENEIAQSVCSTGAGFVRYWLHSEHLVLSGEKMSKSIGNIIALDELIKQGYSPRVLRFVLLATHYRARVNLTEETLGAAQASLARLDTVRFAAESAEGTGDVRPELGELIDKTRELFTDSIQDDLGIAGALAAIFEFVSDVHRLNARSALSGLEGERILALWNELDGVLGVLCPEKQTLSDEIFSLVQQRFDARKLKNFALSDQIRDELKKRGYEVKDTPAGSEIIWDQGRIVIPQDK